MSYTEIPQHTYHTGIKLYELAVEKETTEKEERLLTVGLVGSTLLGAKLWGKSIDAASLVYPDVPNETKEQDIVQYQNDLHILNQVKTDSMLIKKADGHLAFISVAQQKADVTQAIASVDAQPDTVHSPFAHQLGTVATFLPAIGFTLALGYSLFVTGKNLRTKEKEMYQQDATRHFTLGLFTKSKDILDQVNAYAKQHDLPVRHTPQKPKKVWGLL